MRMSKVLLGLLGGLFLFVAVIFVYREYLGPAPETPTPVATPAADEGPRLISAEGRVVPARQVSLAFTQPGRVKDLYYQVGDRVREGEILARLDDAHLSAVVRQAEAALVTVNAGLEAARLRYEQTQQAAQASSAPTRILEWINPPEDIDRPWYFSLEEKIAAAEEEVLAAEMELTEARQDFQDALGNASNSGILEAENRLALAQAAYRVAREVAEKARAGEDEALEEQAESYYDRALEDLNAAQENYDDILDADGTTLILEARARSAIAQERLDTATDRFNALRAEEEAPEVRSARQAVEQASAGVDEARAALESARLALEEASLVASMDGLVVTIDLEPGQVVSPGMPVVFLIDDSTWRVETIDLAESDVVLVESGMQAAVILDAFPGESFEGVVREIGYVGETLRGSVTYRVTLDFEAANRPIRWGMTAFVDIYINQ
jgi:multidrug resistance efflux pump